MRMSATSRSVRATEELAELLQAGEILTNRRNHHSNCNSSCVREDMLWTI